MEFAGRSGIMGGDGRVGCVGRAGGLGRVGRVGGGKFGFEINVKAESFFPQAIARATIQPIMVQPKNILTTIVLPLFRIDLAIAMIVGTK